MARLLIPTRNRPTSLLSVIRFLERFHPGTEVVVADGSAPEYAEQNARALTAPGLGIAVDYRRYPYELPFFDRILDVLRGESDPFFVMGSDDDFPLMDVLARAEKRLVADAAAVTAMGAILHLFLRSETRLQARLGFAAPLAGAAPLNRARRYSAWPFSTTYAVTRREHLVERYERARELFVTGFYDFGVGLHDCLVGKVVALPDFGFIATRNFNHSYLRPERPLVFLRRSDEILRMIEQVAADLVRCEGLDPGEAEALSETMFLRRIAENAGVPAHRLRGFENTRHFLNDVIQRQFRLFRDVFVEGTAARERHLERLVFVRDAMVAAAASTDNAGEAHRIETLDRQMRGQRRAPPAADARRDGGEATATAPRELVSINQDVDPATLLCRDRRRPDVVHVLALGQSNLASHGVSAGTSAFGGVLHAGRRHPLRDPIPGGSGTGGSVWPRLADQLANLGLARDLVVTLRAQSGTAVADWAAGGAQYAALAAALPAIAAGEPPVTHIVWHQGERDTLLGTSTDDYVARFASLHELVRRFLPGVPWLVCRASLRAGATSAAVIAAQERIVAELPGCFPGPDTDRLGAEWRYDETHFNDRGLADFAQLLAMALAERPGRASEDVGAGSQTASVLSSRRF